MRLRQVVLAARDLDGALGELCAVLGADPASAFRDPEVAYFGLRNAVLPIGDTFLEIVSPIRADAPAARHLERRGDGGYMVMLQSDDLDTDMARAGALGVRTVWSADLPDIRGRHLHPRDVGGAIVSLDQPVPPEAWRWAGPGWERHRDAARAREIVAVELESEEPAALARRWAEILGRSVAPSAEGGAVIGLERGAIRFVRSRTGRSSGVSGFDIAPREPDRWLEAARARGATIEGRCVLMCGVRIGVCST